MIPELCREAINLGRDAERMTPADAHRQHATVARILKAFFGAPESRSEIQLLADEVGLGKTYVALAVAYAVLDTLRHYKGDDLPPELSKCYRAVLVVTPAGNHALNAKWQDEVAALRKRCSVDESKTDWFRSIVCNSPEELFVNLGRASDLRRTRTPCVLVCEANMFTRKLRHTGERLRFLTACLFRWWSNRLNKEERYHIVRRAEGAKGYADWPQYASWVRKGEYEVELWDFKDHDRYLAASDGDRAQWPMPSRVLYDLTPFSYEEMTRALGRFEQTEKGEELLGNMDWGRRQGEEEPRGLLPYCKWVAERRGHGEWYFDGFKKRLLDLYRELLPYLLKADGRHFPLVIADEAHHWRNVERLDCRAFGQFVAPFARRLLMLTATPFQLHRDELLSVLSRVEGMEPAIGSERLQALSQRFGHLRRALAESEEAGRQFSVAWGKLDQPVTTLPHLPAEIDPRTRELEKHWAPLHAAIPGAREEILRGIPSAMRSFFRSALKLADANRRLREVMAPLVIRHRRPTEHRRYWVGHEYPPPEDARHTRPDRSQLHRAPGGSLSPEAELAQYLLMKVVADANRGKQRTALGIDLTGCYTTLWKSREGHKAADNALSSGQPSVLKLLKRLTGQGYTEKNPRDIRHPKVAIVVKEVLKRWDRGEKVLLFCFRVPTAEVLHGILADEVSKRLKRQRNALMEARGTSKEIDPDKAMQQFRRSLTAREGSGVPLFLDRILLGWLNETGVRVPRLRHVDYKYLADLCARARHKGRLLFSNLERPDRVFLHRAIEHTLARRLLETKDWFAAPPTAEEHEATRTLLEELAAEKWVCSRYGQASLGKEEYLGGTSEQTEQVARSSLAAVYELLPEADPGIAANVLRDFIEDRPRGNRPRLIDGLLSGPNLFAPLGEELLSRLGEEGRKRVGEMWRLLWQVTRPQNAWRWEERGKVLDAVVRAFLREDILLRLPATVFRAGEETWAESLLLGLHVTPRRSLHREPVAARVVEFLQEMSEMSDEERQSHLRYAMNPRAESVKLVTGSGGDRDAVFKGFNMPLLPDILICTQVGQEGIDLHRHCRHVIHYDLGWNPAAVEQRTGRIDRIGSKAARELKLAKQEEGNAVPEDQLPGLDVALPYLAGTYDDRMFGCLHSRAQTFDILTGGTPTASQEGTLIELNPDAEGQEDGPALVPLPQQLLDDLRVNLAVET
jgi:hypothetical protein